MNISIPAFQNLSFTNFHFLGGCSAGGSNYFASAVLCSTSLAGWSWKVKTGIAAAAWLNCICSRDGTARRGLERMANVSNCTLLIRLRWTASNSPTADSPTSGLDPVVSGYSLVFQLSSAPLLAHTLLRNAIRGQESRRIGYFTPKHELFKYGLNRNFPFESSLDLVTRVKFTKF